MMLDVATGMQYLHSQSPVIIHGDLKSPSVLIDGDWVAKVKYACLWMQIWARVCRRYICTCDFPMSSVRLLGLCDHVSRISFAVSVLSAFQRTGFVWIRSQTSAWQE